MAYEVGVAQATIGRADNDGICEDGGIGYMMRLPFNDDPSPSAARLLEHRQDEWDYASASAAHNVEIIPELRAIAPQGRLAVDAMTLYDVDDDPSGAWAKTNAQSLANVSENWTLQKVAGFPNTDFAYFADGRPFDSTNGYFGELTLRSGHYLPSDPSITLRSYRHAPLPHVLTNRYNYVELQLLGSGFGQWSLVMPGGGAVDGPFTNPTLGWREEDGDAWTVVQEFRSPGGGEALRERYEEVVWEIIDGHFIFRFGDGNSATETRHAYWVPPEYWSVPSRNPIIQAGPARLIVYNHMAAVNLSGIQYPLDNCFAQRKKEIEVDFGIFNTASIVDRSIVHETSPPNVVTTAIATEELQSTVGSIKAYLPKMSFTSNNASHRAIAYLHQLDFEPIVAAGTSDDWESQGEGIMVNASGALTNEFRNATCDLSIEVDLGDADALIAPWKGNNKVSVDGGWDLTVGDDITTQFTGRLAGNPRMREGGADEMVFVDVDARDEFLRMERKGWAFMGSFQQRQVHEMFRRCLNQHGVPDTLIKVWDTTTEALVVFGSFTGSTPTIPDSGRTADLTFNFVEQTPWIQAMNLMVSATGWRYGWHPEGYWFIRPPAVWTTGDTPSWTLDDDSVLRDMVTNIRVDPLVLEAIKGRRFVNNVLARGPNGDVEWRRNEPSHHDPNADDFIADDWWEILLGDDEESAAALAERILGERTGRALILSFSATPTGTDISPKTLVELIPDDFMKIGDATGVGAATDSIWQVIRKRWRVSNSVYHADFDAKFVV